MIRKTILLAALAPLIASCNNFQETVSSDNEVADSIKSVLQSITVTNELENEELEINARVECDESKMSKVFVPCCGKISGIKVEIGDRVTHGQILATVNSTDAAEYGKQSSEAENELRIAERELQMKIDMQKSGMVSDKDVAEAQSRVNVAKSECARLKTVAGINGYASHSHALLCSPRTGFVINKNVYNDSYIDDTNNDDPAFEIADLSDVWIIANVYESDIKKIHQGQKAYITTMTYGGESLYGKIDKIYNVLDNDSKTMKVRMRLHNKMTADADGTPQPMLKPGMFALLHVVTGTEQREIPTVPDECVIFENGHNYVVIDEGNGNYHRNEVKIAHSSNGRSFISEGVTSGNRVVSSNALLIFNALAQ